MLVCSCLICILHSSSFYFLYSFTLSLFFFFTQKTAYEILISYWSSDVCSSDLASACFRPFTACRVKRPGSPGPAPTIQTLPASKVGRERESGSMKSTLDGGGWPS